MTKWFNETLAPSWGQRFEIEEVLFESKTDHQHLIIFQNKLFGRVVALDGIIQLTERDNFIYHEMMAHVPLFAHGAATRVLLIGGGDGGLLKEVLKHPSVEHVTMVEIDASVVEMCKSYLPMVSDGAFDDSRLDLVIDDGHAFVQSCTETFDVVITDSTDPVGPGEILFESSFYKGCKRCLTPEGILVTQNGVPFTQDDELKNTCRRLTPLFEDARFYTVPVPTYVGGVMTLGWATDRLEHRMTDLDTLEQRFAQAGFKTKFYTPDIHRGAFALPRYVLELMDDALADLPS